MFKKTFLTTFSKQTCNGSLANTKMYVKQKRISGWEVNFWFRELKRTFEINLFKTEQRGRVVN